MVAYYLWPPMAVALIVASASWRRLAATSAVVTAVTFASQVKWHGPWSWWTPMIIGLGLVIAAAGRSAAPGAARPVGTMPRMRFAIAIPQFYRDGEFDPEASGLLSVPRGRARLR